MTTTKIYHNTCTKAYMMSEQGSGFSLRPFGNNTEYYEGFDDGGVDYVLPNGFAIAESCCPGTFEIYQGDYPATLTSLFGVPSIIDRAGKHHRLQAA